VPLFDVLDSLHKYGADRFTPILCSKKEVIVRSLNLGRPQAHKVHYNNERTDEAFVPRSDNTAPLMLFIAARCHGGR